MINIKTYTIVILLLLNIVNFAQDEYTEKDKQSDLTVLNDPSSDDNFYVFFRVYENNVYEAIPIIEKNFWHYNRLHQTLALKTIHILNSENTSEFAYRLLDTLNAYPENLQWKTWDYKVEITEILCELGDFSTVEYAFEMLEKNRRYKELTIDNILFMIIKHHPLYKDRARRELENNVILGTDIYMLIPLSYLEETYGSEVIPFLIQAFKEAPESATRLIILDKYFRKYKNEIDLQTILREQLYADTTSSVRLQIAKVLLFGVGGSNNYKFVKDYISIESDSTVKSLINFKIKHYRPNPYDSTVTASTMLDTLISYTNQSYSYGWITKKGIYNSLSKKLENTKKDLTKDKIKTAKNKLEAYKNEVDAQNGKHITENGYKFLYYFSTYIIERLQNGE